MGKGRIGDLQFFLYFAYHESFRMRGEQQLHDSQSGLGAHGGEHVSVFGDPLGRFGRGGRFRTCHTSIILEIPMHCKWQSRAALGGRAEAPVPTRTTNPPTEY